MTKQEFHEMYSKPDKECNGYELHLKHLFDNNNSKSIFKITGLDFSDMFTGEDTSGIQIGPRPVMTYKSKYID